MSPVFIFIYFFLLFFLNICFFMSLFLLLATSSVCICLYDVSYARLFSGVKFFLFYIFFFRKKTFKNLIFAQARRFNGFLFTSSCILRSFCLKISFIINFMYEKERKKKICLELLRKFISKYDDALPLKFVITMILF